LRCALQFGQTRLRVARIRLQLGCCRLPNRCNRFALRSRVGELLVDRPEILGRPDWDVDRAAVEVVIDGAILAGDWIDV
jgi:hypothetical protein